mgnify:CR=1 FL=1
MYLSIVAIDTFGLFTLNLDRIKSYGLVKNVFHGIIPHHEYTLGTPCHQEHSHSSIWLMDFLHST